MKQCVDEERDVRWRDEEWDERARVQSVSRQICREASSMGWWARWLFGLQGGRGKNESCSECPETHFGFGISDVQWNFVNLKLFWTVRNQPIGWTDILTRWCLLSCPRPSSLVWCYQALPVYSILMANLVALLPWGKNPWIPVQGFCPLGGATNEYLYWSQILSWVRIRSTPSDLTWTRPDLMPCHLVLGLKPSDSVWALGLACPSQIIGDGSLITMSTKNELNAVPWCWLVWQ